MRSCRVLVLFLLFSLSFWFMMLPSPVLASGSDNYFCDFETDYVNGDQLSETWGYSYQSGGDYCKVSSTVAYSGSYSYKTYHDGAYGIFHFNNTDFESLSLRVNVQETSSLKYLSLQFLNATGESSILEARLETKATDSNSYVNIIAYDGVNPEVSAGSLWFSKTSWARISITKVTSSTWNFSLYNPSNEFVCGITSGQNELWSEWNGTIQFYSRGNSVYFDDFSYNGGVGAVGTADGNTTINVYNESSGNAITGWSLKIYDEYGGVYYNQNGLSNPVSINHSVYGTGETYFQFGADGYENRTYYADIENGIAYTLDAYLLQENTSDIHLYYIKVENKYSENIFDAEIEIMRNIDESLEVISSGFTDSYGLYGVYLQGGKEYKINISHEDYEDIVLDSLLPDVSYYGINYPIPYTMGFATIDFENNTDILVFEGYISGTTLYVNYTDSNGSTVDTWIDVWEINQSNGNETFFNSDSRTGDSDFTATFSSVNNSNSYRVHLFVNHSTFGFQELEFIVIGLTMGYRDLTDKDTFDDMFTDVLGDNPLGWSNTFLLLVLICGFLAFGQLMAGFGMVITGFVFSFFNFIIGLHITDLVIPVLLIVMGIVLQWIRWSASSSRGGGWV